MPAENARGVDVNTALFAAIERGEAHLVPQLIDRGANVNFTRGDGWTPLMIAARHGQPDVVRELLATGADPDARTDQGWTALSAGMAGGNEEVVLTLLEETGNSIRSVSRPDGVPPVDRAVAVSAARPRR